MLFENGVYVVERKNLVFRRILPPDSQTLEWIVQRISRRVGAYLECEGLLVQDIENS